MKRKIVLHGPSTMTVSLPSEWVKRYGVAKGDELSMEERGRELHIRLDKERTSKSKEIDIGTLKRVGKSCITSAYRQGFDELTLHFQHPSYREVVHDLLSKELTGLEIIRQTSTSCTLKDLTGHTADEFHNALRRIWLLLIDLSEATHDSLVKGTESDYAAIPDMDRSINKFSNYCLRILVKNNNQDDYQKLLHYHIIKTLEKIGDQYKDLCTYYSRPLRAADAQSLALCKQVNGLLNELYSLFYKKDLARTEELFERTKQVHNSLLATSRVTTVYLGAICREIRDFLSIIVEMNL
jgi:phosphate uptake regulator